MNDIVSLYGFLTLFDDTDVAIYFKDHEKCYGWGLTSNYLLSTLDNNMLNAIVKSATIDDDDDADGRPAVSVIIDYDPKEAEE